MILHHKAVCFYQVFVCDHSNLGLPNFATANFEVVKIFETKHPYFNYQNRKLDVACEENFHVAYLFEQFVLEKDYDYLTLTNTITNVKILRTLTIIYCSTENCNLIFGCR